MSSISVAGDVSGAISIAAPSAAGSGVLTLPTGTDTLVGKATTDTLTNKTLTSPTITGATITVAATAAPAFSAYASTTQTITTGVATKIQFNTEEFDTNSNYDNATNYRFTPTVAGYYQVSAAYNTDSTALSRANIIIYKNGSAAKAGADYSNYTGINTLTVSALISMNGSTDYLEVYSLQTGTIVKVSASQNASYFQAAMVRSA